MTAERSHLHFDFAGLSPRDRYKLLIGTVIPRPIAFVTTVNEKGLANAAPYSFFNCLSADPAIVAIGVENKPDMRFKDTAYNVRVTEQFTVNIVDDAMLEAMNVWPCRSRRMWTNSPRRASPRCPARMWRVRGSRRRRRHSSAAAS